MDIFPCISLSRSQEFLHITPSITAFTPVFFPFRVCSLPSWPGRKRTLLSSLYLCIVINTRECDRQGCRGAFPEGTTRPHVACMPHAWPSPSPRRAPTPGAAPWGQHPCVAHLPPHPSTHFSYPPWALMFRVPCQGGGNYPSMWMPASPPGLGLWPSHL